MPQGQRKRARWSPAVHGPHVQPLCSFLRTGNPGRPQGSQLSEASVPLNAKTFVIRGGNSKIPSAGPELTSCTTNFQMPEWLRSGPEFRGCCGQGRHSRSPSSPSPSPPTALRPPASQRDMPRGQGCWPSPHPTTQRQLSASRQVAFIFPVYSRLPRSPGLSRSGPALANSVNYLVCAKTQVACKLRPACNFPQTCFGGL